MKTLQNLADKLEGVAEAEAIVATVAALAYLHLNAFDTRHEWRLLAKKAEEWLDGKLDGTAHDRAEIMAHARRVVR